MLTVLLATLATQEQDLTERRDALQSELSEVNEQLDLIEVTRAKLTAGEELTDAPLATVRPMDTPKLPRVGGELIIACIDNTPTLAPPDPPVLTATVP